MSIIALLYGRSLLTASYSTAFIYCGTQNPLARVPFPNRQVVFTLEGAMLDASAVLPPSSTT
jgi:hypothetical protein